ncbi:hypothetical protein KQX54_011835 [Cotesia glomerata]|uniref:Uncharacterized protein n=1 Tax=Cotesia glomerata TaxID=32391 RepID=A0AAV7J3B6_COTGL|nr:hypothetical protein KQX54_011835 [Cotesia glomerata]
MSTSSANPQPSRKPTIRRGRRKEKEILPLALINACHGFVSRGIASKPSLWRQKASTQVYELSVQERDKEIFRQRAEENRGKKLKRRKLWLWRAAGIVLSRPNDHEQHSMYTSEGTANLRYSLVLKQH